MAKEKGINLLSDSRTAFEISGLLAEMLAEAYSNKPLSMLPQIFTEFKRDEIVNIYSGHGTEKEKQAVYDIVSEINASQNTYWNRIKR